MLKEVQSAVDFVVHILSLSGTIPQIEIEHFGECLEKVLHLKFDRHWFPQKPFQGSAFRCIRVTQRHMDNDLDKAANMCSVTSSDLRKCLPQEFTMWIDPNDVSYRIGEDGSICEISPNENEESTTTSTMQDSPVILSQSCQSEVSRPTLDSSSSGTSYAQCWS